MIVAIIQARMSSTRLPRKMLADIAGRPMLWHVANRVKRARHVDQVVVATSDQPADEPIEDFCRAEGIECFRGSMDDVLDRFHQAARHYKADAVVRITGDCPLIDPEVIDKVVARYLEGDLDYASNYLRYSFPDGLDTEIFSFSALEYAGQYATEPRQREHVVPFIKNHDGFRKANVGNENDLSQEQHRWVVDEPRDLDFVREVYARLDRGDGPQFGMKEVLELLSEEPDLREINQGITLNEGAYRSFAKEAPLPAQTRSLKRSEDLKSRAGKVIPSYTQTFSKGPTQYVQGVAPSFIARGEGCRVWDVDGNEYIDYPMALGPITLGHNYPAVSEAVMRQMRDGTIFSLSHPLEVEVAEMLVDVIPSAEMVRYGKNGSDATSGAIRAARAYTGRDIIACYGYHGWQDWFIGTTTRNKGVPRAVQELTFTFDYNNIGSLEKIFAEHPGRVAAVIMEPVGVVEPKDDFLRKVRTITEREGALLIFDEIVTGFRVALGGAQEHYGVTPDLTCCGKGMGNGYPIAAVAGRRDVMELFDEIFFSFTFGGEALSLAATKATITEMRDKDVIGHLWEQGRRLRDGFNVLATAYGIAENAECVGLGPRTSTSFKDESGATWLELKSLFQQECLKRGVLFLGGHNLCYSHGNADIDQTLRVYRTAMEICTVAIKEADVPGRLEGDPVQAVFRHP